MNTELFVGEPVPLDYAESDSALDIDRGIRETILGIRLSILAMGLGLANMKAKGLYKDLGFKTMAAYIKKLGDETQMDRRGVSNWLYIGEAYQKYRKDLEKIAFNDSDGPTKLPYLDRALETNQKTTVFSNIKKMSVRDFAKFSKGTGNGINEKQFVSIKDDEVYINGILAVKINKKLNKTAYNHFRKINLAAGKAMSNRETLCMVRLNGMEEVRRFEKGAQYLIHKIRNGVGKF